MAARRADRLLAIVNEIEQEGGESVYIKADVISSEDMQKVAQLALKQNGRIDVVNNAGTYFGIRTAIHYPRQWSMDIIRACCW